VRSSRTLVLAALVAATLASCRGDDGRSSSAHAVTPSTASPSGRGDAEENEPQDLVGGLEDPAEEEARSGFQGKIDPLPQGVAAEMQGTTWRAGCPVALEDLRLLHFNYVGFDGVLKRGPMVVNASVAEDVLWVFHQLFEARFPIKHVGLAREFHPQRFEAHRRISSNRSVTASFNCRPVVTALGPGTDFSQHAYGLAIDVNPLQNPYVTTSGFVRNRMAERYLDRSRHLEGMIHGGDLVVRSFASIGWEWGGNWSGDRDYMHFSLLGR
jgi:D-alanyl-D-alanine carboxypeptidase-like protein